ncbi:MAG: polysaccharide deacetylase family protein [Actinomycetes bacterium]
MRAKTIACRPDVGRNLIALSFDDGPGEWTEPILEILRAESVPATFFVIGEAVVLRESVLAATYAEGHEIGNHTLTHARLPPLSRKEIRHELTATADIVEAAIGQRPTVFRPPYLDVSWRVRSVAHSCGYDTAVLASAWAKDWVLDSPEPIVARVLEMAAQGGIIDLHDGRPPRSADSVSRPDRWPTVRAVREIVPKLLDRGYEFVTVSQLLAA